MTGISSEQLCSRLFKTVTLWLLLVILHPCQGFSQQLGIAYQDYMKAIGWEGDFIVMKNILQNELANKIEDKPAEYYNDNAEFFSMVLLLSSVKPTHYYKLQQNGVDVINAITANVRPFDEQSLFSDVVITGTVSEIIPEQYDDDGFDITLAIQVTELLKGEIPADTIRIRQRNSSRLPGSDTRPELHQTYLFLLSSGMYGYHKANHQMRGKDEIVVSPPQFGNEDTFVIYRLYPYRNGQLIRSPQTKDAAFNSLRAVDYLLRQQ